MANETLNAAEMTSGPVPAIHAGLNSRRIRYTYAATMSGAQNLNLCKLPKGAEVVAVGLWTDAAAEGDAADTYCIRDNESNQYMVTSVPATTDAGLMSPLYKRGNAANGRITGSAHLILQTNVKAATGTAALTIEVTVLYKAEKSGD